MKDKSSPNMSALFYDPTNPGRQDVIQVKINESLPLLDLDSTKTEIAARKSIFMDASSLESLMDIMLTKSDPDEPHQQKQSRELLKTFIIRGFFNTLDTLKGEFLENLQ